MHDSPDHAVATVEIAPPDAPPEAASAQPLALRFTGSGREYFRIWIINLLLTVASLGIYSAWAKVRRLQYFYRNTELAGATFDFHGAPRAIFRGRLLAVALVGAYHYAFGFSLQVGMAVAAMLVLGLPYLMRSALRFRLSNTRYRGLAFSFNGSLGGAYLAYFPPIATVMLPGLLLSIDRTGKLTLAAFLLYFAWPAMHGAMKGYQHRNLQYGDQPASYKVNALRFYRPYLLAFLLILAAIIVFIVVAIIIIAIVVIALKMAGGAGAATGTPARAAGMGAGIVAFYICILAAGGPYMQARLYNLAWSNTSFTGVRIRSGLTAWGMLRLQVVNTLLTLLTLGLYRPFAVVRLHRYRLAHLTLEADGGFEETVAGAQPRHAGAAGDGAADFLGMDISW